MAQTVSEKRTVITTSSGGSGYDSLEDIPYKASFGSRSSNVMSRSSLPLRSSSGGSTITRTVEYGYGSHMGGTMGPGGFSNVSNSGVNTVKTHREKEKKDLQDLNERFASYIEKVRFLEAQNRKLGTELDELRSKWGKETTQIKQMYEAELAEARRLIDDLSKDKAALEIKMSSMQEQFGDMQRQLDEAKKYRQVDREQIAKLNQQLADCESEINMLRRTIESLETERSRDKATINRLQQEVDKLRIDLNNETLAHLDAENRRQTLEEEMEFMKKVHEQELKELAALAYRDTTAENREFWKSELGQAIRDIQQEYDAKVEQLRGDMEGFYNLKIQEYRTGATKQNMEVTHIREENKKLTKQMSDFRSKLADLEARNAQLENQYKEACRELELKENDHMMETTQLREEILKLRAEMEGILTELQSLMDAKLSLELEIAAYRKLLEGEENRVDWRSRASLIMYRDAFKPSSTDRSRAESTKEKETEKPFEAKSEKTVSRQPEQREASPDTDAASSITMSDNEMSAKGDEGDLELEEHNGETGVDTKKVESEIIVDLDNTGIGTGSGSVDSVKSPVIEHVVKVKEQVQKIETKNANDETDSTLHEHKNGTETTIIETERVVVESTIPVKEREKSPSPVKEEIESVTHVAVESALQQKPKSPVETDSENESETQQESSTTVNDTRLQEDNLVQENNKEVDSAVRHASPSPAKSPEKTISITEQVVKEVDEDDVKFSQKEEKKSPDSGKDIDKSVESTTLSSSKDLDEDTSTRSADDKKQSEQVNENDLINGNVKYNVVLTSEHTVIEDSKTDFKQNEITPKEQDAKEDSKGDEQTRVEDGEKKQITSESKTVENVSQVKHVQLENEPEAKPVESTNVQHAEKEGSKTDTKEEELVNTQHITIEESTVESKVDEHSSIEQKQVTVGQNESEITEKAEVVEEEVEAESKQPEQTSIEQDKGKESDIEIKQNESTSIEQTGAKAGELTSNEQNGVQEFETKSSLEKECKTQSNEDESFSKEQPISEQEKSEKYEEKNENRKEETTTKENTISTSSKDSEVINVDTSSESASSSIESKVVSLGEYMEQKNEISVSSVDVKEESAIENKVLDVSLTKTENKIENTSVDDIVEEKDQKPKSPSPKKDEIEMCKSTFLDESKSKIESRNDLADQESELSKTSLNTKSDLVIEQESSAKVQEKEVVEKEEIKSGIDLTEEITEVSSASKIESKIVSLSEYTQKTKETTKTETVSEHISVAETTESKHESIEKTEDKILESVVQSKMIEKSQQDPARIEMSPTKELPDSFPDSKQVDKDQTSAEELVLVSSHAASVKSPVSEKPGLPDNLPESHSLEHIEDDKTPEDEVKADDKKFADPLSGTKDKNADFSKIDENQKPLNTVDVQHVELISNSDNAIDKTDQTGKSTTSDKEDEITDKTSFSKEQDIMTQSFIAENGLLTNGDIKDDDTKANITATLADEDAVLLKTNADKQEQSKDKPTGEDPLKIKTDDKSQKPDTVLQEKIENLLLNGQDSQVSMKMMRGEVSAKTTYQRTSTGPIAISEVNPEGRYITLENTSSGPNKKDVNLDGWRLRRTIDGRKECCYNFRNFTLKAGKKVKIMARGCANEAGLNDLVFREEDNWGIGQQVTTCLLNEKEEEKASHIQKTNYN